MNLFFFSSIIVVISNDKHPFVVVVVGAVVVADAAVCSRHRAYKPTTCSRIKGGVGRCLMFSTVSAYFAVCLYDPRQLASSYHNNISVIIGR